MNRRLQWFAAHASIRVKIIVVALATAAIAVLTSSVALTLHKYGEAQQALCTEVASTAGVLAANLRAAVVFDNQRGAREILEGLYANPRIRSARIERNNDPRAFAAWQADPDGGSRTWFIPTCTYSSPIRSDGELHGLLWLEAADVDFPNMVAGTSLVLLAAGAVGLLVALAIGLKLASLIARPIAQLAGAAKRVGSGADYQLRVAQHTEDEIGQLIGDFNRMLEQIQRRDAELATYRDSLEQQVESRTAQLRDAMEAAQSASRAKSQFLATMSHEIRTPMNGVLGMNELLLGTTLSAQQRQWAEAAQNSGHHLLGVINDILDYSKIEAGQLALESVDFDLVHLVDDALSMFAQAAEAKGLELAARFMPRNARFGLRGDPLRLRQVLVNLIGNAVKFTESGEVVVDAALSEAGPGTARLVLSVTDTGIGVAPEAHARIFEHFSQADGSMARKYGGSGLGLAICQRLISLMGGSIHLESAPGRGSRFWVELTLPRADLAPGEEPPSARFDGRRVLVVDDNQTNREILQQQLEDWRMAVTCAADGPEALAMMARAADSASPFDLAILDMHMPRMDGLQLAQAIHGQPALSRTPLMMLTSTYASADQTARRAAGIVRCVSKPIRRSDLRQVVSAVLTGAAEPAEPQRAAPVPAAAGAGGRVLLVEDNPINQSLARAMLQRLGLEATVVADGRAAVEQAGLRDFDIVLMDCQMPVMDGYEATAAIRALAPSTRARVPIVALTANTMHDDQAKCIAAGMDDFLAKPYTLAQLQLAVERWLGRAGGGVRAVSDSRPPAGRSDDRILNPATLAALRELDPAGGNGLLVEMLRSFLEMAESGMTKVSDAIAAGNAEALRQAAHALKSATANVGAERLSACHAALERTARAGQLEPARDLLAQTRHAHGEAMAAVHDILRTEGA